MTSQVQVLELFRAYGQPQTGRFLAGWEQVKRKTNTGSLFLFGAQASHLDGNHGGGLVFQSLPSLFLPTYSLYFVLTQVVPKKPPEMSGITIQNPVK